MNIKRKEDHHFALQRAFDTPWPGPQGEPVILENENLRLDVYPQDGARIVSLRAFGFEVLRQWTPQRRERAVRPRGAQPRTAGAGKRFCL
jgi:hypothetical protein